MITPGLLGGIFLALGEEIGWRGLLVPQLARLTTFTKTALLSGGIQAAWHWPFVLFAGFSSAAPPWYALSILTFTVTLAGFSAAWLRLRSGQSVAGCPCPRQLQPLRAERVQSAHVDTGVTEYIVDEFGFGFVVSESVIAYIFWRLRHRLPPFPGSDIQPASAA